MYFKICESSFEWNPYSTGKLEAVYIYFNNWYGNAWEEYASEFCKEHIKYVGNQFNKVK